MRASAWEFMNDLAPRLAHRVQLTTDAPKVYLDGVNDAFGANIDYALLVKLYGEDKTEEQRYSPPKCNAPKRRTVQGTTVRLTTHGRVATDCSSIA